MNTKHSHFLGTSTPLKIGAGTVGICTVAAFTAYVSMTSVNYRWQRVVEIKQISGFFGSSRIAIVEKGDVLHSATAGNLPLWFEVGTYVCISATRWGTQRQADYGIEMPALCKGDPKPVPHLSTLRAE